MQISLPKPQPKQQEFLKATKKNVGFGGARGGGKSWAVDFKAIVMALKYAGIRQCIVRRTYPELIANHVKPMKLLLGIGQKGAIAKYNASEKEITFVNGSTIKFNYCSNDKDLDHFQGTEYDIIYLDEATQLTEYQMKIIAACVRGTNGFPKRIYYTCNPGGQGMGYIKRIFIDRRYEDGEDPDDYEFIQSLVTDNYALMKSNPDYIKQLEALPPKLREAWLKGRWDVFDGAFFEEFRLTPDPQMCHDYGIDEDEALTQHRFTHVIEPFEIPHSWKIYRSYDWGFGKPFSCAWWAQSEDDTLYRILELYGCTRTPNEGIKWTNKMQMDKIQEIEREHRWLKGKRIQGVADPSIWDGSHDTYGISCAEEAEKHGLIFEKGNNERIAGWMQVRERLRFDEEGKAKIYFFNNCKAIIRTLPLMMFDEHKPEDLDTTLEDHAPDDVRYMCMHRPIPPRMIQPKYIPEFDPLSQYISQKATYKNL